jgi:hypothetical protein
MNGTQVQLERRRLNEEIESAFIIAAKAASNIEMKMFSGKGSITGDLQDFYNNFNYLNRLTCNLKEMETKEETEKLAILKLKVKNWLRNGIARINDEKQVGMIARSGIDLFDDYYGALVHCGLVTLPTKR